MGIITGGTICLHSVEFLVKEGGTTINASYNRTDHQEPQPRRGTIAVMVALCLVVILGLGALAVDIGYLTRVQSQLRNAVDAAVLAGAGAMSDGEEAAIATVRE